MAYSEENVYAATPTKLLTLISCQYMYTVLQNLPKHLKVFEETKNHLESDIATI